MGGVNRSPWLDALRLLGLGWYIVTPVVIGAVGGLLLDDWVHTSPLFILLGLALGLLVAFWGTYKLVRPMLKGDGKGKR